MVHPWQLVHRPLHVSHIIAIEKCCFGFKTFAVMSRRLKTSERYPDMDEQRRILRRHTASLKQLHAVHQMLLPGGQLLRVNMVDAQIVLNRPEFSGPQPGWRVPAEALAVPVLPLPVHRRLSRPLFAALCAAFLFAFAGLEALERAVYLPEELPGLVFGAERVVFGVIS